MIIDKKMYDKRIAELNDVYWNKEKKNGYRRWEYFEKVIAELHKIPNEKVLEVGVYMMPLTTHSDVLDLTPCNTAKTMYKRDATVVPWEFAADKQYDVVIANQVLEHCGTSQREIFKEMQRISSYALITLPYKWDCQKINPSHHNINEEHFEKWFGGIGELYYEEEINERYLLCYRF